MKAIDSRHEVPPYGLLPYKYHRQNPYIYNKKEVIALLNACKTFTCGNGLRRHTYYTLFGLLAVTGMRISELVALTIEDVDLTHGIITIRQSKLGKSRLLPLHKSTVNMLNKYGHKRDEIYPATKGSHFFFK
jgi:integrase